MNYIYLVKRISEGGYDTFDSFVCIAPSEEAARLTHPKGTDEYKWSGDAWEDDGGYRDHTWEDITKVTAQLLGKASKDWKPGVVCASFHAG